ncbi:MAG: DUF177 domain-containing protein [Clostridia bacterium]|nr:DUF177 domain-containing protein [Clostridia bacterium]
MFIELNDVFQNEDSRIDFDRTVELDGSTDKEDSYFASGITCVGEITNRAGMVTLKGTAEFDYLAPCDRCAEETMTHYSVPFTHKLIEHSNGEDNDEYIVLDSTRLDLDSLVYEDVILSLPMQYLCSPECKGLCPICGRNRNEGACDCKKPSDPRLAALDVFLDN